ncbi:MAG: hypothetical protein H6718_31840 [Polyangiaceae bacterium]|nr:hypothetical protein [Myxococcales bacterium]MCB9590050.1 hypothetical protein [Polyangiaceae bacterium]
MLQLRGLWSGLLRGVTAEFPQGYHVILGRQEDGLVDLAECLTGARATKPGCVALSGADPFRSAHTRRKIGSVLPLEPEFPRGNIEQLLTQRLPRQSEQAAGELLATCNLLDRKAQSLTADERRSVAFLLATSVARVALIAYEPFTALPGIPAQVVMTRLAHQAERGACVIVLTSNPSHAQYLEGRGWLLDRGRLLELERDHALLGGSQQLVIECEKSSRLARALLEVGGLGVSYDAGRPTQLTLTGPSERASLAAMHAALELGLEITRISSVTPTVDQLRARAAGAAQAAFHQARIQPSDAAQRGAVSSEAPVATDAAAQREPEHQA